MTVGLFLVFGEVSALLKNMSVTTSNYSSKGLNSVIPTSSQHSTTNRNWVAYLTTGIRAQDPVTKEHDSWNCTSYTHRICGFKDDSSTNTTKYSSATPLLNYKNNRYYSTAAACEAGTPSWVYQSSWTAKGTQTGNSGCSGSFGDGYLQMVGKAWGTTSTLSSVEDYAAQFYSCKSGDTCFYTTFTAYKRVTESFKWVIRNFDVDAGDGSYVRKASQSSSSEMTGVSYSYNNGFYRGRSRTAGAGGEDGETNYNYRLAKQI